MVIVFAVSACTDANNDSAEKLSTAEFTGTSARLGCGKTSGAPTKRAELLSRDFPRARIPIDGGEMIVEYSKPNNRPQVVNGVQVYGRKTPLYVTNGKSVRIQVDRSMRGTAALMYEPTADRTPTASDNLRFSACLLDDEHGVSDFTGWPGAIYSQDADSRVRLVIDDGESVRAQTLRFGRTSCS